MPEKILLLHLNERDGVQPSDSAGNLADLAPSDSVAPTRVASWTGFGRKFVAATEHALVAADLPGRDTLLTRDMTIQAILSMDLISGKQVLIARGLNDGTASERHCWGLELEQQVLWPGYVEARWFWQDSADAIKVQGAGVWKHPGDGKFFLLTCTRRWESTSKVVIRYYIGADLIAELESVDGDISGGTTGSVTLGARQAAGDWECFFNGTIDELVITDHEMSPAEVRHTWRRLSEFQSAGLDMFVGLLPPGLPWAKDLGNYVGRHVKHAGESLGLAIAGAEELRAMIMPDAAPLGIIERWERICGTPARPRDSLDARQARVCGYLAREEGFHHSAIQEALSGLLKLDPADVDIREFSNTQTDAFDELDTDERWLVGDVGTWSISAGKLRAELPSGSDVQWSTARLNAHIRMPVDNDGDVEGLYASAKLVAYDLPNQVGCGILLVCRRTDNALYFGAFNDSGTDKLVYRKIVAGVPGPSVELDASIAGVHWLRLAPATNGVVGSFRFMWSTTSGTAGFSELDDVAIGLTDMDWVGFGVFGDDDTTATDLEVDWDDFLVHAPGSPRPFNWYVYVDPALSPNPDIIGARHLVAKTKPAHTNASVIQSLSLLAGNARDGLVGRGPLGGF